MLQKHEGSKYILCNTVLEIFYSIPDAFQHLGWKYPLKLSTLCKQACSDGGYIEQNHFYQFRF